MFSNLAFTQCKPACPKSDTPHSVSLYTADLGGTHCGVRTNLRHQAKTAIKELINIYL